MRVVRDGLFHHPEGATAQAILKRMAEGTTSYHFDDPFKPAIDAALLHKSADGRTFPIPGQ
ncbi:MAG: hypothetical protein V4551_15545, partial [Pseudomonadota bacterium]